MAFIDVSSFVHENKSAVEFNVTHFNLDGGFAVTARLSIYDDCSTYLVNIQNNDGTIIRSFLGGYSCEENHIEFCRNEMNYYLASEQFKKDCEEFVAEYKCA